MYDKVSFHSFAHGGSLAFGLDILLHRGRIPVVNWLSFTQNNVLGNLDPGDI